MCLTVGPFSLAFRGTVCLLHHGQWQDRWTYTVTDCTQLCVCKSYCTRINPRSTVEDNKEWDWWRVLHRTQHKGRHAVCDSTLRSALRYIFTKWLNHSIYGTYSTYSTYVRTYYLNSHLGFRPSITDKHCLQYYQDIATNLYKSEWHEQVNHIRDNSESGGRLNIYRNIKIDLVTESYVSNERSVGVRRVLAGWPLPLGVETGRYTGIPYYQRTCRLCDLGEVEDQHHFLITCPTFTDLRLQLIQLLLFLSQTFLTFSWLVKHI